MEAWSQLILDYHKHHKTYTLDITEAQSSQLFNNKKINRKLPVDAIYVILEDLRKKGHVEWRDKDRKQCLVMWRTPQEWGNIIYQWISSRGMTNTVCTLFELVNGDDSEGEDFHGLEMEVLMKALRSLESQRKAEIIGDEGVKFF